MTNSDTNRMEEDRFPIRSYGKGELAMLYIEGVKQPSAVKEFNAWVRKSPVWPSARYFLGSRFMGSLKLKFPPDPQRLSDLCFAPS